MQRDLDGPPEVADGEPIGGARMLRGSTGATAFSILDARDLPVRAAAARRGTRRARLSPRLEAGPNGLEVLAFGSHAPGDGELVADWWTT